MTRERTLAHEQHVAAAGLVSHPLGAAASASRPPRAGQAITLWRHCMGIRNERQSGKQPEKERLPMIDAVEASSHTLSLPDGRTLGYLDYGPQAGHPLFYFHGYPAARLEAGLFAQPAAEAGL